MAKKVMPKALQEQIIRKMIGSDNDLVDVSAEIDGSLSLTENIEQFKQKGYIKENLEEKAVDYIDEIRENAIIEAKEQYEKRLEEIRNNSIKELDTYYANYRYHIRRFLDNKIVNGFIVEGKGGFGKSTNLEKELMDYFGIKDKKESKKWELLKGHISNLSFYRFLYENKDNEIIVIDDVVKLIKSEEILALLLGAVDYNNRIVEWTSNSPLTRDLPDSFMFNSKIFILANEIDTQNEFLSALKDRCIYYKLNFTKEQILEMLYILAKNKGYPLEIVDYIKEMSEVNAIQNLTLRLLDKVYSYYKNENWKGLVKEILDIDEEKSVVLQILKECKTTKEQLKRFMEETGMSRRTFFRLKKSLLSGEKVNWGN